jgi:hypothetical protein
MNFDPEVSPWNMPELKWDWGYPFALAVMALVAISQLVFFRRRGWLGPPTFIRQQPRGSAEQPARDSRAPIRERGGGK